MARLRPLVTIVVSAFAIMLGATQEAAAFRGRVSFLDAVGVGGAAIFGPTYRQRTWSGTPYFQFTQPRFYTSYPLPRTIIRAPQWNSTRW